MTVECAAAAESAPSVTADERKRDHYANIERFYAEYRGRLTRIARRLSHGVLDPDDLLSETVLRSLESATDLRSPAGLYSYLATSMRNRVIDEARAPRHGNVAISPAVEALLSAPVATPANDLDERSLVWRALERMPVVHRRYILRTVVDGCKPRELTEEFGRPAPALSSLAQRARQSMSEALLDVLSEQCAARGHRQPGLTHCWTCLEVWFDIALTYGSRPAAERELDRWSERQARAK
ncbi:sigma-70 family RNA polymerase sigma factor [Microbacterium sp. Leaf320]|uniref:sigma-70 family RNA polymerase sigma factor n=1 Tax=Microbacterium sp. Leaf320 TaxID=1736334 RepID=UPI000A73242D|nr:sigma-70 family RNA polymerase sigma factor [Microbacterium sp. Leaf320]